MSMIETIVESIRVSLVNQNRVVILKELEGSRHLPIWIGVYEAEAIAMEIQGVTAARPLPYDLVKAAIVDLGGVIERVAVTELSDEIYYARIFVRQGERSVEIDSRPSDAIAIAVRAQVPILVDERVMDQASLVPDDDDDDAATPAAVEAESLGGAGGGDEDLSVFRDFINTLDLDDFDKKAGA
jgi:bifunctional DNase/RNase